MFIIIRDNDYQFKKKTDGHSFRYRGISIYPNKDNYYLNLDSGYYLEGGLKNIKLECKKYLIGIENYYYNIELYVYPDDSGIDSYSYYVTKNFIGAPSRKADVCFKDPYLKDKYITMKNGFLDSNFPLYVNHKLYDSHQLEDGDLIEMLGLSFIYFSSFIYMNHFYVDINLEEYKINSKLIRYSKKKADHSYFIEDRYPELIIDPLEEYKPLEDRNNSDIIRNIAPNIVMSLSIGASAYLAISSSSSYQSNNYSYLISLIGMSLTGIVLPVFFFYHEKRIFHKDYQKHKKEYLDYLGNYENELNEKVDVFFKENSRRYFSYNTLNNEPFYLNKDSDDFLSITLGKISLNRNIEYAKSDDKDIDDACYRINRNINSLIEYPLLYSLKENNVTTIVSKRKHYFFERFILELSYKHHYEDMNIGIYSDDLKIIDDYYNLPHLFTDRRRNFFRSVKELIEADQKKLNRPLIIFMDKKADFIFSNSHIRVIYFSDNRKDIYRGTKNIVEFMNNDGYLHGNEDIHFSYIQEDADTRKIFNTLSAYSSLYAEKPSYCFMNVFTKTDIRKSYMERHSDLRADFAWYDDSLLEFDLHEKGQGPHGLIGGTTGSGKSELIVSLLLSLCIRYSPEYLNIVLIDYKGGGLKESLSYMNRSVPHIIGAVDNLDGNVIERMIIALNNECKRRQLLFKKLSEKTNTSIMNLDDYLDNSPDEKIAHLLIVVDEFAELKKENPEQIKELISISRIGRSLGVHLILATQKPSGNIDEEIFSNSHFKIALKVFEVKDSNDLIRSNDAAYLNEPGSFYLKVEESLIKARSIYAKKAMNENEPYVVKILDHHLDTLECKKINRESGVSEAMYFVKKINDICDEMNLKIPELNFMSDEEMERRRIEGRIMMGISDDYLDDRHEIISYDINDNLLIYSDRKDEINAVLNSLHENNRKTIYIGNKEKVRENICDYLDYDNEEDILFLFEELLNDNPDLCLVVEDIGCLLSYNEDYLTYICKLLKRSENMKFNFIFISRSCQLPYKLLNCFKNRLFINDNDKNNLAYFFGTSSRYKGKSFYYADEVIPFVPIRIESFKEGKRSNENYIRHIPETVLPEIRNNQFMIGYDLKNRKTIYSNKDILVVSNSDELLSRYKKAYPDILCRRYDISLNSYDGDILWLGPGVYSQRLFIYEFKGDLRKNEGCFIHEGIQYVLRSIDHV